MAKDWMNEECIERWTLVFLRNDGSVSCFLSSHARSHLLYIPFCCPHRSHHVELPLPSRVVGYQTNNCSVPLGLCLFARVQRWISPIQNSAHDDTIGVSDSIGSRNNTGPGRPFSIAATVVMLPSGGDLQLGGGGHFTRPVGPEDTAD